MIAALRRRREAREAAERAAEQAALEAEHAAAEGLRRNAEEVRWY